MITISHIINGTSNPQDNMCLLFCYVMPQRAQQMIVSLSLDNPAWPHSLYMIRLPTGGSVLTLYKMLRSSRRHQ